MSGVTDPLQELFKDGGWGWDGTRWRKLNLLWGFYDTYSATVYQPTSPGGVYYMDFPAVPAGQVWVVTGAAACDINTSTVIYAIGNLSGINQFVWRWGAPGAGVYVCMPLTNTVMKAGDYWRFCFEASVLNDDLYGHVWGYKMLVT